MTPLRWLIRLTRPLFLLAVVLLYALGTGVAHYLGHVPDWGRYLLGQLWVIVIYLGAQFLNEYELALQDGRFPGRVPLLEDGERLSRQVALAGALTCLAAGASLAVLVIQLSGAAFSIYLVMLVIFLGAFFYAAPPLRLVDSGYGELALTVIVVLLVPLLAYLFQSSETHRLLPMATFPLAALYLALTLAFELSHYAADIKYSRCTLLVRMGWQNGMLLHNLLILTAYLLLALAAALGMSFAIVLPAFLTFPLGILQIWTIQRIAAGAPTNWRSLTLMAIALFGLVAYLLTYGFWIR